MATLASTLVSDKYTTTFDANGFLTEVWEVASGGTLGDTCVITPNKGRFVISAVGGPCSANTATDGSSTNVTLTLTMGGTAATSTIGAFRVNLTTKQ